MFACNIFNAPPIALWVIKQLHDVFVYLYEIVFLHVIVFMYVFVFLYVFGVSRCLPAQYSMLHLLHYGVPECICDCIRISAIVIVSRCSHAKYLMPYLRVEGLLVIPHFQCCFESRDFLVLHASICSKYQYSYHLQIYKYSLISFVFQNISSIGI